MAVWVTQRRPTGFAEAQDPNPQAVGDRVVAKAPLSRTSSLNTEPITASVTLFLLLQQVCVGDPFFAVSASEWPFPASWASCLLLSSLVSLHVGGLCRVPGRLVSFCLPSCGWALPGSWVSWPPLSPCVSCMWVAALVATKLEVSQPALVLELPKPRVLPDDPCPRVGWPTESKPVGWGMFEVN